MFSLFPGALSSTLKWTIPLKHEQQTNKQNQTKPFSCPSSLPNPRGKCHSKETSGRTGLSTYNIDGFAEVKAGIQTTGDITPTGRTEREQMCACPSSVTLCKTHALEGRRPQWAGLPSITNHQDSQSSTDTPTGRPAQSGPSLTPFR